MKILFLGDNNNKIINYFNNNYIDYMLYNDKINANIIKDNNINFIISYRYRYIIKKDIIDLNIPIVNLHISYLPWNKGADPNLWSFIENSKKGITIHYINDGVDTGDIIYQEEFEFINENDTLANTYLFLNDKIQDLFIKNYSNIINNNCPRIKQNINEGSFHKSIEKNLFFEKIEQNDGWNIKIKELKNIKLDYNIMKINNKVIGGNNKTYIIAELSANHNQDLNTALKLVEEAAKSGANAIKLQTYTADTITINCKSDLFKIKGTHLWDDQYLYDLYKKAYTPWEWHPILFDKAKELGLDYFSSPFDTTAVDFLESLNVSCYKIASCEITDHILCKRIGETKKPVIISSGMASKQELQEAVDTLRKYGTTEICMLKCTAEYPASPSDANLLTIKDMIESFNVVGGLSDHTLGIEVPIASVCMGAKVIEKHFTLSRDSGSPDDAFSLTPIEFKQMVDSIRIVETTLGKVTYGGVKGETSMKNFRRSLFFVKDLKEGDIIDETNVKSIRPSYGIHTKHYWDILGKKVNQDIKFGTPVSFDLISL